MLSVICTIFIMCFVAMYCNGAQFFNIDSLEVLCISLVNQYDLASNYRDSTMLLLILMYAHSSLRALTHYIHLPLPITECDLYCKNCCGVSAWRRDERPCLQWNALVPLLELVRVSCRIMLPFILTCAYSSIHAPIPCMY